MGVGGVNEVNGGGGGASGEALLALAYDELRQVAARYLRGEREDHTLQPTALVHEAYLRLAARHSPFESRLHFVHAAAKAMRQVLTDHAKARNAIKRGGGRRRCDLAMVGPADGAGSAPLDILALDEALQRLEAFDPRGVRMIELRFYGGLSNEEVARVIGCCESTVEKDLRAARAWLHKEIAAPGAA